MSKPNTNQNANQQSNQQDNQSLTQPLNYSSNHGSNQHILPSLNKPVNKKSVVFAKNLQEQGLTEKQVIEVERKLAKFANTMDSLVRVPFTKQGLGVDTALSTFPIAGDVAGLVLTAYAFMLGRQVGVPKRKLIPAVRLALVDSIVGIIPVVGTLVDVFIRPSRRTLEIVRGHVQTEYGIADTRHVERPFLHQSLENKQQTSAVWRNPVLAWLYLHIPDILGLIVIIILALALWGVISWLINLF